MAAPTPIPFSQRMSYSEIERRLMIDVPPTAPFYIEDRQIPTWDGKTATIKAFKTYTRTWRDLYIKYRRTFGNQTNREAFVYSDLSQGITERQTYPEHFGLIGATARALAAAPYNVKKGDRIGIASRNCSEWMAVWWACHVLGACCVQLNAFLAGPELEWCARFTNCRIIFGDDDRMQSLRPFEKQMRAEGLEHLIVYRRDPRRKLTERNPEGYGYWPGVKLWKEDFLKGQDLKDQTIPEVKVSEDDLCIMLFSSGTTGRPKAIPGTNFQWLQAVRFIELVGARQSLRHGLPLPPNYPDHDKLALPQSCLLLTTPFFHLGGLGAAIAPLLNGGKIVMLYKWEVGEGLLLLSREKCTSTILIPTMAQQLLVHPDANKHDLSSLIGITLGAMSVDPSLPARTKAIAPMAGTTNSYGASEALGITVNAPPEHLEKPESVGPCFLPTRFQIRDTETGEDITHFHSPDKSGDIWLNGPQISMGYHNAPEANKGVYVDGWYQTGDVGYIDKDGWLYLMDRSKDMLIRGGENIAPAAVEAVINTHPAVMQSTVFGVPDPVYGDEVAAVISLKPGYKLGDVTPEQIREFCRPKLARFQLPVMIEFTTEPLPVGTTFKTKKKEIRAEFIEKLKRGGEALRAKL